MTNQTTQQQRKHMSDINTAAETLTGDWVKLTRKEHGAIEGRVIAFETRPMTFEGDPVLNRKTGQQRTEWVLAVLTDNDETLKFSLKEAGQRAIAEAIKQTGQPAKNGDRIKIAVKDDPPTEREQPTYQVRWTPDTAPLDMPTAAAGEEEPF
jgi:hypothetical protein